MLKRTIFFGTMCLLALNVSCKPEDSDDDKASDTADTQTGIPGVAAQITAANALAGAYPAGLAIASFPRAVNGTSLALQTKEEDEKLLSDKVADQKAILKGEAANCIDMDLFSGPHEPEMVTCYEFDADMNPSMFEGEDREVGTLDGTDGKGEACMVAYARTQVQGAVDTVDQALSLLAGMLCQAKKDGQASDLPAVGESLDLATSLANATDGAMNVTTASIARLEDIDSRAVYKTDIEVANDEGDAMEVHLVHSPGDNDTSRGTLWFLSPGGEAPADMEHDPNNSANKNNAMSINYERVYEGDEYKMRFEVRRAAIVNTIEPFDAQGLVNYGAVADDAENADIHAISYVAFEINPLTNAGNISYWKNPGGNYNESARGFLFNLAADPETGVLSGCGTSGSTDQVSIRKALNEPSADNVLKPVGYYHPREVDNIHPDKDDRYTDNEGDLITEQCFKQNADGLYAIDTDVTTHERGYDVIAGEESSVEPPTTPEATLDGEFVD